MVGVLAGCGNNNSSTETGSGNPETGSGTTETPAPVNTNGSTSMEDVMGSLIEGSRKCSPA